MRTIYKYSKAGLLWGFCFCFVFSVTGQEPYMFFRYGIKNGSTEGLDFVGELNGQYVGLGWTHDVIGDRGKSAYFSFNESGQIIDSTVTDIDSVSLTMGWYGAPFIHNGRIIGSGGYTYWNGEKDAYIAKYNGLGEMVNLSIMERDSFNVFSQGKLASDGNYIFAGVTCEFDYECDYYLVKTDTNGNVLWEQTYGTEYYEYGLSVANTHDGGYLIYGSSRGYGDWIGVYSDGLLIKTDSEGNEEWRKHWGKLHGECNWNVEPTPDGGYVTCGCLSDDNNNQASNGYIRKVNANGNLEWDAEFKKDMDNGNPWVFRMCRVMSNGNIVAAGNGYTKTFQQVPWLVILSPKGKLLMSRGYTSFLGGDTTGNQTDADFEDIRLTIDGGFIAGGTYYPGQGDTGNQDMFIVKLDSAGCEYPGCQPPLAVEDPIAQPTVHIHYFQLEVWPNPVSSLLHIDTGGLRIQWLQITDATGRTVNTDWDGASTLNVSRLPEGVYFLHAGTDRGARTGKFVKVLH